MRLIFIIFIYLLFQSHAISKNIDNFEVNGNKRISKETIIVIGGINIDKDIDENEINNALKKLYNSNFFSDIEIFISEKTLVINVQENPIISNIEFTNIKKESLIEDLRDLMSLKQRNSFSKNKLRSDLNTIRNFLKGRGYYFSNVESSFVKNEQLNSVDLIIDVELGQKSKIKKISFIGDKKIKDKKLLRIIASEEHKFWKFLSKKVYLNQSIVDLDVRLLKNYYKNLGYYDIKIENTVAEFDEKGFFELIFTVNSGKEYFFNNLNLDLPQDYNKKDFQKLNDLFVELKDTRYSLDNLNRILTQIEKIASERLYDFINVDVEEKIVNKNKINLLFKLKTQKNFILKELMF